jgi:electron transfer flavoprotein alpha subunit
MAKVFIIVEHRQGVIRDATFELVTLARELETTSGLEPAAVVIGRGVKGFADTLSKTMRSPISATRRTPPCSGTCSRRKRRS